MKKKQSQNRCQCDECLLLPKKLRAPCGPKAKYANHHWLKNKAVQLMLKERRAEKRKERLRKKAAEKILAEKKQQEQTKRIEKLKQKIQIAQKRHEEMIRKPPMGSPTFLKHFGMNRDPNEVVYIDEFGNRQLIDDSDESYDSLIEYTV